MPTLQESAAMVLVRPRDGSHRHIYCLAGDWDRAIESNVLAVEADEREAAVRPSQSRRECNTVYAAERIFRGDRVAATAATGIFRGDGSRRRGGGDGDIPWRRVAATPRRRRGYSVETGRGDAAAATGIFRSQIGSPAGTDVTTGTC